MQTKLTSDDLPLIIIGIIGSILLILFFAKCFRNVAKKCERNNMKIINIPLMVIYAIPIFAMCVYTEIHTDISYTTKVLYIVISVIVFLIPTIYNVTKLGILGVFVSLFQAVCGLMLSAIALASIATVILILGIGFIGSGMGDNNNDRKILRSVDNGGIVNVTYYGDGYWKDDLGNCYYEYSSGRWIDDYNRDYIE